VQERPVSMEEVLNADEIWLTSSSKELVPVIEVDGRSVGGGEVGDVWLAAQRIYTAGKFNY